MAGKVKYNQLNEFEKKKFLGDFYDMISLLKNREEAKKFFKDLLTLSEVVMISRRLQVAKMLLTGMGFEEIRSDLKVGYSTIHQVERWLKNGFGGYRPIIERHSKLVKNKIKYSRDKKGLDDETPMTFGWLKKKYPVHFALFNLLDKK